MAVRKTAAKKKVRKSPAKVSPEKMKTPAKPVPAWVPPPMADRVLNAETMAPRREMSPSLHALLGSSPRTLSYRVRSGLLGTPSEDVVADGHEISPEGRLMLRRGFVIVAIYDAHCWGSFRITEAPED